MCESSGSSDHSRLQRANHANEFCEGAVSVTGGIILHYEPITNPQDGESDDFNPITFHQEEREREGEREFSSVETFQSSEC